MSNNSPPLQKMFAKVPRRYDFTNRVMTLGLDTRWRRRAIVRCLEEHPKSVLDLCTGTGDFAIDLAKTASADTSIVAADFNKTMIDVAEAKARKAGVAERVSFEIADAAYLPFEDASFDAVGIAFGFRNLTFENAHKERHLREISRIIAPSGRFVIVESSQPVSRFVKVGFRLYLRGYVRPIGGLISGERSAYRYLAHSAENYYTNVEVQNLLYYVGFTSVESSPLLFGASAIHVAIK